MSANEKSLAHYKLGYHKSNVRTSAAYRSPTVSINHTLSHRPHRSHTVRERWLSVSTYRLLTNFCSLQIVYSLHRRGITPSKWCLVVHWELSQRLGRPLKETNSFPLTSYNYVRFFVANLRVQVNNASALSAPQKYIGYRHTRGKARSTYAPVVLTNYRIENSNGCPGNVMHKPILKSIK